MEYKLTLNKMFLGILKLLAILVIGLSLFTPSTFASDFLFVTDFNTRPIFDSEKLLDSPLRPVENENYRVPILLYHYIENITDKNDYTRYSLNTPPAVFESQVKTLREAGYTFLTVSDLSRAINGGMSLPEKPVIITIDDGHYDLDTVILTILRKYDAKATAYIITGFIGGTDFLSKDQLIDVINSNLIEVGAHTVHHVALKGLSLDVLNYEVLQGKKDLENEYKIRPVSFAYPDGSFDGAAINAVSEAGFTSAVSTKPGINQSKYNKYSLYRIRPGFKTGDELLNFLSQDNFEEWPQK